MPDAGSCTLEAAVGVTWDKFDIIILYLKAIEEAARRPSPGGSCFDYRSNVSTVLGAALAWANIAVPACCKI